MAHVSGANAARQSGKWPTQPYGRLRESALVTTTTPQDMIESNEGRESELSRAVSERMLFKGRRPTGWLLGLAAVCALVAVQGWQVVRSEEWRADANARKCRYADVKASAQVDRHCRTPVHASL